MSGRSSISIWKIKIRNLRKAIKGWSCNIETEFRNLKKDMMLDYDSLDIKAEIFALPPEDLDRLKHIRLEMNKFWLKEETKTRKDLEMGISRRVIRTLLTSMH